MLDNLERWTRSGAARLTALARRGNGHRPPDEEPLWERRKTRVYFDDQDLDVYLSFILGRAAARGASLGESMVAASQVDGRDPTSWARAWSRVATAAQQHADALVERDRKS